MAPPVAGTPGNGGRMRILERYIRRQIVGGTLIAILVLATLIAFIALVDQLDDVGRGSYSVGNAFEYVALRVPHFAYQVFPVAALLGSLIGLGRLANQSELIAMRAAGVSMRGIVIVVLKTGMYMLAVALLVGEGVAPLGDQAATRLRVEAISEQITLKSRYGFWARDRAAFINIRQILPGAKLRDIFIYEFNGAKELVLATHARSAEYRGNAWLLKDIRQTRLQKARTESQAYPFADWESLIDPELLKVAVSPPDSLPAWGLYSYIRFMRENGQDARLYEVTFWSKIITPLVTLMMLFLSVPFVFGSLRSVGIGQRVFAGTLIGMGFLLLNQAVGQVAVVYEMNPVLAVSFPALLFFVIVIWYARRQT